MVGLGNKDTRRAPPVVPGLNIEGGTIAGRYRVEELLGAGSSGFVVTARHVYLRRRVTLKLLSSTTSQHQEAQRRHLVAAHQAAALRGRHVAKIVDTGFAENGMPFIATERLEGRTLAEELAERHELPPAEAVRWVLQACEGLAEAHAAGIVHGDLKPQNLFLAEEASTSSTDDGKRVSRVLKILDFGMATPVDDRDDEGTVAWFASPAYLAPEQIRDPLNVDARADVWALGVILFELLTGRTPFSGDARSIIAQIVSDPVVPPSRWVPTLPASLVSVVMRSLAKDPAARFQSAEELRRALAPFSETIEPITEVLARLPPASVPRRNLGASRPSMDGLREARTKLSFESSSPRKRAWAKQAFALPLFAALGAAAGLAVWKRDEILRLPRAQAS
ncbi:MAG: serine/threonine protein kinase, partial [Myxococcales bacterium]|nr:serine/threonine protein kinase [Myxococcales bacterium]